MHKSMSIQHRHCEPVALRRIWKAIDMIRGQRQIANIARLTKVIQRDHPYRAKVIMQYILQAIQDNVVIETLTVGCKGSKAGLEQEGYWIPEDHDILKLKGMRDCYCFVCHKPGKLLNCNACNKAYHKDCNSTYLPPQDSGDVTFLCQFCCGRNTILPLNMERKQELNRCLRFIARRAMDAVATLVSQPSPDNYTHYQYFISEHQTLRGIAEDCVRQKFESIGAFEIQINLILHNCVILEGNDSVLVAEAKKMVSICSRELKELELCINCYLLSTTKPSRSWFCLPCSPPHKVVWAKQKGFEYWPAKVIQIADGKIDVRFFGGHHERAWLALSSIKCITMSPAELHIKKTKSWMKASDEMKQYLAQTEAMLGRVSAKSIVEFEAPSNGDFTNGHSILGKDIYLSLVATNRETYLKRTASKMEMEVDTSLPCTSKSVTDLSNNSEKRPTAECERSNSENSMDQSMEKAILPGENATVNGKMDDLSPHLSKVLPPQRERAQKYCRRSLPKLKREKCNCRRIYSRKLFFYQSTVRRMRLKERRNNLMLSANFIHQYLKKHSNRFIAIQKENEQLRADNAELKAKLRDLQQNKHTA